MNRIPLALQLYSVREDAARDLPAVLEAVAKMGYEGVEFAGYYGHDAVTLKKLLDDNGLKVAGAHVGLETLVGDELTKSIEFAQTIGNRFLIVPGLSSARRDTEEHLQETIETMNGISETLKPLGMKTGYHNHDWEFQSFTPDGPVIWDLFFGGTSSDVVMQFDTGNALHGGAEALPYLERYPGRATTVHLKEHSDTNPNALIGEGKIPFDRVFAVCESTGGTEWYIVEQESYAFPPLECVDRCLQQLKAMGK